jgi:hypothetical protein
MLDQGTEGHIVNTASIAGLISYSPDAAYHLTKHAVVALSEKLYYDLALRGASVRVSVLCPGMVNTRIIDGGRNRPPELQDDRSTREVTPEMVVGLFIQTRDLLDHPWCNVPHKNVVSSQVDYRHRWICVYCVCLHPLAKSGLGHLWHCRRTHDRVYDFYVFTLGK